jgi:mRNA interferase MazF
MLSRTETTNEAGRDLDSSGGEDDAGKPGPVVVVKDNSLDATGLIIGCACTTDSSDGPLFRLPVKPNDSNGLRAESRLMVDKMTTMPKAKVGSWTGRLDDEDVVRLNQAIVVFLGLAGSRRASA